MNYILPGFYEKFSLNTKLITLYQKHSEYFIDDFQFGCFYGNFGFNIWSGGRIFFNYKTASIEELQKIKEFYNQHQIPIRLTFTNPLIKEEHLDDRYCNLIMETLHNNYNEVVCNSPILESYLRETYPNFKYCSSTTKCLIKDVDLQKELQNNYYQVCLDYNLNHRFDILDKLSSKEKFKCEFLCNAICPPGCHYRKEHYRLNGLFSLSGGKPFNVECNICGNTVDKDVIEYKNNISPEEIKNVYIPKGFSHFKLEGRTLSDLELTLNLCRYCVKPEYQNQVTMALLN